jgi:hypothetical protein
MGHVHLVVQDGEEGRHEILDHAGRCPTKLGANQPLKFPGVLILLRKASHPAVVWDRW